MKCWKNAPFDSYIRMSTWKSIMLIMTSFVIIDGKIQYIFECLNLKDLLISLSWPMFKLCCHFVNLFKLNMSNQNHDSAARMS